MPDLTLYHLDFGGTLHLGRRGVGQEETGVHLPADSLFGALVAAWVEAGENPERLVKPFLTQPDQIDRSAIPFLLTSAFPYVGEIRFYPPPPLALWNFADETVREKRLKELKRIQFVSETIFAKIVNGEGLEAWLPPEDETAPIERGLYLQKPAFWLTVDEVKELPETLRKIRKRERPYQALRYLQVWQVQKVPRVTVDRLRNASNIFHTGRLNFGPGCGLWFGLIWQAREQQTADWPALIDQTLWLLGDSGLGGERAVGYGHFSWTKKETHAWPQPKAGERFITLSRYHPRRAELPAAMQDEAVAYNLISVGGWLGSLQTSAQRRRRLWMVAEGSVLRAVGAGPWGDVTDVQPVYDFPHPIWRYGLACPIAFGGAP